ncbi:adenylyltransferase/cytidyltransferase family protein [Patescibacteria group bacterium]|nr:adenylyltransferase/cytidyltransferase family protein [Patescibacteria group bacterium]
MDKKTVLVTGVFDLLHEEHLNFLKKAKKLGNRLVIGIESDKRVKEIKGISRPVLSEQIRKKNLEKLLLADEVFILPEQFNKPEDHLNLIKKVGAKILAVSSHTAHLDKKQQIMEKVGGNVVVVHEHNPRVSTSILLEKGR